MDPETSRNHVETVSTLLASLPPPSATPLSNHSPISLLEINKLIAKDDRMPSLVSGLLQYLPAMPPGVHSCCSFLEPFIAAYKSLGFNISFMILYLTCQGLVNTIRNIRSLFLQGLFMEHVGLAGNAASPKSRKPWHLSLSSAGNFTGGICAVLRWPCRKLSDVFMLDELCSWIIRLEPSAFVARELFKRGRPVLERIHTSGKFIVVMSNIYRQRMVAIGHRIGKIVREHYRKAERIICKRRTARRVWKDIVAYIHRCMVVAVVTIIVVQIVICAIIPEDFSSVERTFQMGRGDLRSYKNSQRSRRRVYAARANQR